MCTDRSLTGARVAQICYGDDHGAALAIEELKTRLQGEPVVATKDQGKLAFGASLTLAGAAIYYSHWAQVEDKRLMHQAVIRDKARLKELKRAQQEK